MPDVRSLATFDEIILKCWTQGYESVDELLEDIKIEGIDFHTLRCLALTLS